MPLRRLPFGHALRLRIELLQVRPMVWRTVLVDADIRLWKLHDVIQAAFGWQDQHLHEFRAGEKRWGRADPAFDPPGSVGHERVMLRAILPKDGRLDYTYDFGDGWEHAIQYQGHEPARRQDLPDCVAGAHACPPEDCGGPPGYEELQRVLADPADPEHAAMRRWAGRKFDPVHFVLKTAKTRVRRA